MNRKSIFRKPLKVLLVIAGIILFCAVTMLLWNALMPAIFGLPAIGFFEAAGLLILSRLLLGHGRFGNHNWRRYHYLREKWANLTPEERKNFCEQRYSGFHGSKENSNTEKAAGT
ncbi:MAG: hypothetical protein EHM58_18245 [Ignavibacteriae bacterium]|nr:MAG: hypothetical protein EHM58_18245 [Ignavibacteriota bacterium]